MSVDSLPYREPLNIDEQTQLLIEHGVADIVLSAFHAFYPWARNISVEHCKFWATKSNEEALYTALYGKESPPIIEVVVKYPYYHDADNYYFKDHGMVVSTEGRPYILYGGGALGQDQVVLVAQLSEGTSQW